MGGGSDGQHDGWVEGQMDIVSDCLNFRWAECLMAIKIRNCQESKLLRCETAGI